VVFPPPKIAPGQIDGCPLSFTVLHILELLARDEPERQAVDTVPDVLLREALALKNVAEMAAAVIANDLYPVTVGIANLLDGAGDFVVEAWPAAAGAELILAIVKGRITTATDEYAVYLEVIILVGEGHLGTLVNDDVFLLRGEGVVVFERFHGWITLGMACRFWVVAPSCGPFVFFRSRTSINAISSGCVRGYRAWIPTGWFEVGKTTPMNLSLHLRPRPQQIIE
jgi:hypothetical protein